MVFLAPNGVHARITCSTSVRPPARCNTLARLDFRRVPLPAARMTTARSLFFIGVQFSLWERAEFRNAARQYWLRNTNQGTNRQQKRTAQSAARLIPFRSP